MNIISCSKGQCISSYTLKQNEYCGSFDIDQHSFDVTFPRSDVAGDIFARISTYMVQIELEDDVGNEDYITSLIEVKQEFVPNSDAWSIQDPITKLTVTFYDQYVVKSSLIIETDQDHIISQQPIIASLLTLEMILNGY